MKTLKIYIAVLFGLLFAAQANAFDPEDRCVEMGADCHAAEMFNTNSYTQGVTADYYGPDDSTTKEARGDSQAGFPVIESGSLTITAVNSGEAWDALPAGHTLSWIAKQPDGGGGGAISHSFPSAPTARRSMRFYRYYSTDHVFSPVPVNCNSGKLIQLGSNGAFTSGPLVSIVPGHANFYDVNTTFGYTENMQANCCTSSPGGLTIAQMPTLAQLQGTWWRYEFILHNAVPAGPVTTWELYMKDLSGVWMAGVDTRVIDTSQVRNDAEMGPNSTHFWESPMNDGLHVSAGKTARDFSINMFRSNNGDPCTGHIAHTGVLWAAWSTDSGQRIGAATEIEGGSSPATFKCCTVVNVDMPTLASWLLMDRRRDVVLAQSGE